ITTAPNSYVPLDPTSLSQKGLRTIYEVNPAIAPLIQDVTDLRQQVDRLYYADYLLYLSKNPKTRTATETNAIVNEQQMVIGPNLQSLNWTYNVPVVDYVMDYVLDNDPFLPPPPADLTGRFLSPEFISVFAQAQKAADLPAIDRY
ncbi:portal protein, partial [Bradyrhizobium diazoefficiens]|uniref:portal protein n=1 Tax=Bradyrhizobium diazoefficiens TaxID=1355477 RepID=UPI0030B69ACB